ncbi:MAG: hypothetical protein NTV40_01275 [Solirubrobacterales bacterium]|nr:hypothetical protein [Solirubrobacterales bacterium]
MHDCLIKPTLYVDVDGVISLWDFPQLARPRGSFITVDGIVHYLSGEAARHLRNLARSFDLIWCTGWEETANVYLPQALKLGRSLPYLVLEHGAGPASKRAAIDLDRALNRPFAWIDDNHDTACADWAMTRGVPTLLVTTNHSTGLTQTEADLLSDWAQTIATG